MGGLRVEEWRLDLFQNTRGVPFGEPSGRDFAYPTGRGIGCWEPSHRIYLAQAWILSELVVRHEMLHALLGRAGHPAPPWGRVAR